MNYIVYALIDPNTQEIRYIGKTSNQKRRYKDHHAKKHLEPKTYKNNWIKSLINKGQKAEMLVLESYQNEKDMNQAEIELIEYYRFIGCNLTNGTNGGDGASGYVRTEEQRKAISDRQKGKKFSDEHKANLSKAKKGQGLGSKRSQETKDKIVAVHIGAKRSEETKLKMSAAKKNRTWKLIDGKRVWS